MDVEKTIQFLLENQARFDARMGANFAKAEERFARAEVRFARAEKRMDRVERVVAQLAVAGLRFRNEIRRAQLETGQQIKVLAERQAETDDKLNALIDIVDRAVRRKNGKKN
ncbi:MAG TPA: hypothetical protein VMX16_06520 [Terriglobia bacterium]|nr:hypothetical protein [Terriglobia bacterium]